MLGKLRSSLNFQKNNEFLNRSEIFGISQIVQKCSGILNFQNFWNCISVQMFSFILISRNFRIPQLFRTFQNLRISQILLGIYKLSWIFKNFIMFSNVQYSCGFRNFRNFLIVQKFSEFSNFQNSSESLHFSEHFAFPYGFEIYEFPEFQKCSEFLNFQIFGISKLAELFVISNFQNFRNFLFSRMYGIFKISRFSEFINFPKFTESQNWLNNDRDLLIFTIFGCS